jgi:hypothetical protein
MSQKRNHDDAKGYKSPRAWRDVKRALAKMGTLYSDFAPMLENRADDDGMCVRLELGAAMYLWSTLTKAERMQAFHARCDAEDVRDGKKTTIRPALLNQPAASNPAAQVSTSNPRLRRLLRWLRALELDTEENVIDVDDDAHAVTCPPDTTIAELMGAVDAAAFPPPSEAPARESLPESERATDEDLLEFEWTMYGTGWPMPPNLPAGVSISAPPVEGAPPAVRSDTRRTPPNEWRHFCPHCGKGYKECHAHARHLVKVHGWTDGADGLRPPAAPSERREAA